MRKERVGGIWLNRKYNNKRRKQDNKRKSYYPNPIQRVDEILMVEVNLALQLGLSDSTIIKNYNITRSQLDYCRRKNLKFEDLKKEE